MGQHEGVTSSREGFLRTLPVSQGQPKQSRLVKCKAGEILNFSSIVINMESRPMEAGGP